MKGQYRGADEFVEMTIGMLRDLGTALSQTLYQEVLTELLGGEDIATAMLPMAIATDKLGNQRFHLVDENKEFHVTCFSKIPTDYEGHLLSLLQLSPLTATHWINIDLSKVTFKTMTR